MFEAQEHHPCIADNIGIASERTGIASTKAHQLLGYLPGERNAGMVPCASWIYCRDLAMSLPFHEQHLAFESQGPKLNVATSIATHFFHAEIPLSLHPTGLLGALEMVFRPRCSLRARKQAFDHPIEVRSVMRGKSVDVALHRPPFFTRVFDHRHDDGHAVLLSTVCLAPPSSWHSLFLLRRGTCGGGLAMHRIVPSLLGFPHPGWS